MSEAASSSMYSDNFLTIGAKIIIAGNAAQKATAQALSQIKISLSTKPMLRVLTTNDTRHDTAKAIKKAKMIGWNFLGINLDCLTFLQGKMQLATNPGLFNCN